MSSRLLVATVVMTMCVGTAAAAGPPGTTPPTKKESTAPAAATIASGAVFLLGTLVVYDGEFPSCLDDCYRNEEQMLVGAAILVVAPTLVRLPAREVGGIHLGIRLAGAALIASAAKSRTDNTTPYIVGGGLIVAGALSDLVTVHGAYRRWTERHAISVMPASVAPRGTLAPGLSLGGRY
jgi:hypothetical protein